MTVSLERDNINRAKRSFDGVLFCPTSRPRLRQTIACHAANFALGHYGRAEKPCYKSIPVLLQLIYPGIEPGEILCQKDPLQAASLAGSLKALVQTQEILYLPSTASPTSE